MTTPKRKEIIEEALKLNAKRNYDISTNTPEISELQEDGIYEEARDKLMRDQENYEFLAYLERMAHENGYELVKSKADYCFGLQDFPIKIIMKEGCFVIGGRGCGKTNLLKLLVVELLKHKIEVKVIDSALAWKDYPLPKFRVKDVDSVNNKWNTIYDCSRLSVLEIREFVSEMMSEDVREAILLTDAGRKPKCCYVLEEAQNVILPNSLRTLKFQEISRFVTQGRNFGLSYVCSTQRLASTDVNLVEISGVKYWGKMGGHRNLIKARAWLSKFNTWRLRDLEVGQFYLQIGSKVKLLRLPVFKPTEKVYA